jgi:hypothetical protein
MLSAWPGNVVVGLIVSILFVACGDDGGAAFDDPADAGEAAEQGSPPSVAHGEPLGEPLTQTIGPEGGELRSSDGRLSLTVPPGALAEPTLIGVLEVTATAPQHTGRSFRLSPAGVHFAQPATLRFHYEESDIRGSTAELLRVAYQDEAGVWHLYRQVELDQDAHTVSVHSDHFSDWSLVEGSVLLPVDPYVKIGESIELRVMSCLKPLELGDESVSVTAGYECETDDDFGAFAYGWSVNGVLGGNDMLGTVRESATQPGRAVYTPPKKKPAPNPVAVSVILRDQLTDTFNTQLLISHVDVIDPSASWSGTVTYEVSGSHALTIPPDFTGSETHSYSHKSVFTVTGVTDRNGPRTELTFQQTSDVSYEKDGSRRKEVHEICQAGGPVILRHLFEYSIAGWLVGHYEGSVPGDVWLGDDGQYNISLDAAYIPLDGQDVIVDKYTHFCNGAISDSSGTKDKHSSESVNETYYQGTVDPASPNVLTGSIEKTLSDEYSSKLTVSWNLTRGSE